MKPPIGSVPEYKLYNRDNRIITNAVCVWLCSDCKLRPSRKINFSLSLKKL